MQPLLEGTSLRDRTREQVYGLIRSAGDGVTRRELADASGLSNSTIEHAVARLLAEGRIVKASAQAKGPGSGSGRPGIVLKPAARGGVIGAIDFGHGHVRVAIATDVGELIDEEALRLDVDLDADSAMEVAARQLTAMQQLHSVGELAVVVAGIPGPVDRHTGIVCSPTILSGWVGLDPAAELRRRVGAPVHVENDATLGAHGERIHGAGRAHRDFLYVKASGGIGAGLVLNGLSYTGGTGLAGEIGHTPLPGRTELCRCGRRGCLEAVVSVESIREQVLHTHPGMAAEGVVLGGLGDPVTGRLLEEAGRTLGRALADLCNLFNPTAVIIGGELGASGPALISGVGAAIARYGQPATAAALVVLPAELGVRAELVGAVQLASQLVTV